MKLFIASDIHGDIECARKTVEAYRSEGCERMLILGDILYHGPRNDLPENYAPKKVIELLSGIKDEILAVRGNCDTEVDQMVLPFPILADYAVIYADGLTVYATHGHKYNSQTPPPLSEGDILLHGHTHVLCCKEFGNGNFCLNPGSVTLPKEGNPKTYATLTDGVYRVKDFSGRIIIEKSFI